MTAFGFPDDPVAALRASLRRLAAERGAAMASARRHAAGTVFVGHPSDGGQREHGIHADQAPDWLVRCPGIAWLSTRNAFLYVCVGPVEAWLTTGAPPWIARRADGPWDAPALGLNIPTFPDRIRAGLQQAAQRLARHAPDGLHRLAPGGGETAHARLVREALLDALPDQARHALAEAQDGLDLHRVLHARVQDGACLLVGLAEARRPGAAPIPLHLALSCRRRP